MNNALALLVSQVVLTARYLYEESVDYARPSTPKVKRRCLKWICESDALQQLVMWWYQPLELNNSMLGTDQNFQWGCKALRGSGFRAQKLGNYVVLPRAQEEAWQGFRCILTHCLGPFTPIDHVKGSHLWGSFCTLLTKFFPDFVGAFRCL